MAITQAIKTKRTSLVQREMIERASSDDRKSILELKMHDEEEINRTMEQWEIPREAVELSDDSRVADLPGSEDNKGFNSTMTQHASLAMPCRSSDALKLRRLAATSYLKGCVACCHQELVINESVHTIFGKSGWIKKSVMIW